MDAHTNTVNLHLKITPNASNNEITDYTDGILHVKIAAPPVKGKANREMVSFLSRLLGVKKSSILVTKGQTSRHKIITVEGLDQEEVMKRLSL